MEDNLKGSQSTLFAEDSPVNHSVKPGSEKAKKMTGHLWPEYFRLIQEIRPPWVIGENVSGIISMGLDQVLSDLESEDYSCQTLVVPACAVNAPHRRDRVWILANTRGNGRRGRNHGDEGRNNGPLQIKGPCAGDQPKDVAHANSQRGCGGSTWSKYASDVGQSSRCEGGGSGQLNPTWVEWLMGFPRGWTDSNS